MTSNLRSDVIPETHKVEQEVNSLWEVVKQSFELSDYARPNKEGILKYETGSHKSQILDYISNVESVRYWTFIMVPFAPSFRS